MKKKQYFLKIFKVISILFIASLLISLLLPMFFRDDDAEFMDMAANNKLINLLFNANAGRQGGAFRPIVNLFFYTCFHLFGHNAFGYQVSYTMLFLFDFYLLFVLCAKYFDRSTAIVVLIIYIILFYNHFQMLFWNSDITFILGLMFSFLSIIFYLKKNEKSHNLYISYILAILGTFSKEPSILIISSFVFADFIIHTSPKNYIKEVWIIVPYFCFGLILFLISPVLKSRSLAFNTIPELISSLDSRYTYYFTILLSGTKKIIPILLSGLLLAAAKPSLKKLPILFLAIPCYFNIYYYILFIFSINYFFVFGQKKLLPFLFWIILTSLSLPFMRVFVPTYLFEFSFGFSILLGYSINKYFIQQFYIPFKLANRRMSYIILSSLLIIGFIGAIKPVKEQAKALKYLVEARRNFSEGITFLEKNKNKIKYIVVPDQDDYISVEEVALYSSKVSSEKAKSKKTMHCRYIKNYFSAFQYSNFEIIPYSSYINYPPNKLPTVLLLQNDTDIEFAKEKNLIDKPLFTYSFYNTNHFLICTLKQ